jgi:hypothetical protein
MNDGPANLKILISSGELPADRRVWGTGGWLPPDDREALDWLTFARFLGWEVTLVSTMAEDFDPALSMASHRIVISGDPDNLNAGIVNYLRSQLAAHPALVVARAGAADGVLSRLSGIYCRAERVESSSLRWTGPGPEQRWSCLRRFEANVLAVPTDASVWSTLDGAPVVAARRVGRGVIAALGFHPSRARDSEGGATALLRRLILSGADQPEAWLDWEGTLVLRMDDPGGAENVHHRIYSHTKLREAEWNALSSDLKRREGRVSIGYVSGWVDDGDSLRGSLTVSGRVPRRSPGRVHPSPLVRYEVAGLPERTIHDYTAEFRGIESLRRAGVGDVELHGYTHMHPDTVLWAKAPDRYDSVDWYRELGSAAASVIKNRPASKHPLALGISAFRRFFNTRPTTLICPGEQWTSAVLEWALDLGLQLVGSYYLALREGNRFCWSQHVCAPYLDRPDPAWFAAGMPVVGYFHDFDISRNGVAWFSRWLDEWQVAGAERIIDFRELAAGLGHRFSLEERGGELQLKFFKPNGPAQVRPLIVAIRPGKQSMPAAISVHYEDREILVPVEKRPYGIGRVRVPVLSRPEVPTAVDCANRNRAPWLGSY